MLMGCDRSAKRGARFPHRSTASAASELEAPDRPARFFIRGLIPTRQYRSRKAACGWLCKWCSACDVANPHGGRFDRSCHRRGGHRQPSRYRSNPAPFFARPIPGQGARRAQVRSRRRRSSKDVPHLPASGPLRCIIGFLRGLGRQARKQKKKKSKKKKQVQGPRRLQARHQETGSRTFGPIRRTCDRPSLVRGLPGPWRRPHRGVGARRRWSQPVGADPCFSVIANAETRGPTRPSRAGRPVVPGRTRGDLDLRLPVPPPSSGLHLRTRNRGEWSIVIRGHVPGTSIWALHGVRGGSSAAQTWIVFCRPGPGSVQRRWPLAALRNLGRSHQATWNTAGVKKTGKPGRSGLGTKRVVRVRKSGEVVMGQKAELKGTRRRRRIATPGQKLEGGAGPRPGPRAGRLTAMSGSVCAPIGRHTGYRSRPFRGGGLIDDS